jgi:hypothetical protein
MYKGRVGSLNLQILSTSIANKFEELSVVCLAYLLMSSKCGHLRGCRMDKRLLFVALNSIFRKYGLD